ncbi:MAG: glycosyltransferase [Chloroflexota bacterium]
MSEVIIAAIIIYLLRVSVVFFGAARERARTQAKPILNYRRVSIVTPARNEEANIERAIRSIMNSDYPPELFEVIAVNDRSEDGTGAILERLKGEFPNLIPIHITEQTKDSNLKGKAGALERGLSAANGEILLMTDADCTVHEQWIRSLVSLYDDPKLGIAASFTLIEGERAFDKIQSAEWMYMHTMAQAGVGLSQIVGCYGNNLSVLAKAYKEVGGYRNIPFSVTEDYALLKAITNAGWGARYLCSPGSTVTTYPCKTFTEYISQHRRWAAGGTALGWKAALFVVSSLAVWIALAIAVWQGNLLWIFSLLFARIVGDYFVVRPSATQLKEYRVIEWIVLSVVFFMFVELILPFLMINRKIVWKGQTFK